VTDPGDGTQESALCRTQEMGQPGRKRQELRLADCVQVMLTLMLVLLARMPECTAFRAYDCNTRAPRSSSTRCWTPSRAAT
jgi:hypothetical protein